MWDSSTFILTARKLLRYKNGIIKNVIDIKGTGMYSLFKGSQKRIWITTTNGKFYKIQNDKIYEYAGANNYKLNTAKCITEDKYKTIWIGTNKGIFRMIINTAEELKHVE